MTQGSIGLLCHGKGELLIAATTSLWVRMRHIDISTYRLHHKPLSRPGLLSRFVVDFTTHPQGTCIVIVMKDAYLPLLQINLDASSIKWRPHEPPSSRKGAAPALLANLATSFGTGSASIFTSSSRVSSKARLLGFGNTSREVRPNE